jgi:8-oxo-dGTP pyrophosphatase MutT (NUDIX family)
MSQRQPQLYPFPAVRALIGNPLDQILVLRRTNSTFGQGGWCLPGGKIDVGQTIEEALAAELQEELSVQLVSARFFFYQDSLPPGPGGLHFINFYFHCDIVGQLRLNNESSEFAWIGPSDLQNYDIVFRNDEAIRRHFIDRSSLSCLCPKRG